MKKKLACMLLMGALALSMTACGGKDNNGAASDNQQSTMESTAAGQETGETGSTTAAQNPKDAAKALQSAKKAVTDALGDNYWPDSEIPGEMLNETYGVSLVNDTMQYPMNLGKIQASRVERIGDYVCFVQLGADTSSVEEQGDEAVITYCQEQNELALEAIRQTLE